MRIIENVKRLIRKLSIVQKISLSVIVLILLILAVINSLVISQQRRALRAEMEKGHLVLVKNLARDVVEPLIVTDPLRLEELVRTASQTPECVYSFIVDPNKRIVAHTDRKRLGTALSPEVRRRYDVVASRGEEHIQDLAQDGIKEIMAPVKVGYEVVGAAIVGFSKDSLESVIEDNLSRLKRHILMLSAVITVMGIVGAIGLAKLLTTRIKKLKDKMELVQQGVLDAEIPNESPVRCHEVLGCDAAHCPAYERARCWTVPGTRCFGEFQGSAIEKVVLCRKCIVYRESCGDEIGELIEVFNEMVRRLKESISQLEETNREKARFEKLSALGEMSMTVAHEIKNPLNAIGGAVSYLKDNFEGEVLSEFLSIIEEETKRLNEIATSFLTFSRPMPLSLKVSDINQTVKETVGLIRQEATENNVEVVMSLDGTIPRFGFDPQQFKQALLNIVVNALDATQAGGTIRISTVRVDSRAHVAVSDTGAGIPGEMVSEIFKPFFTTKTRGSGLGLACVERIVRDHKGEVSVRSEAGKGTEFVISLPLSDGPFVS